MQRVELVTATGGSASAFVFQRGHRRRHGPPGSRPHHRHWRQREHLLAAGEPNYAYDGAVIWSYVLAQASVPCQPRSVRRDHVPEREPSGLIAMVRITVRPLIRQATARKFPMTWPTPTCLPLSQSSSRAPEGAMDTSRICVPT